MIEKSPATQEGVHLPSSATAMPPPMSERAVADDAGPRSTGVPAVPWLMSNVMLFAMPETFAIFDDQAAQSIAMWRYFAFACEGLSTADEGIQFSWRVTGGDKGGSGYRSILDLPPTETLVPAAAPALAVRLADLDLR